MLYLEEHSSSTYPPRTVVNAEAAELTCAFAVDFNTAGEKLTKRVSKNIVEFAMFDDPEKAINEAIQARDALQADKLNIAGNSIKTFARFNITQEMVNRAVYTTLVHLHINRPITHIRSGGQTGTDFAALVAGVKLGIPTLGLFPKGFMQRGVDGVDYLNTEEELRALIEQYVNKLKI